MSTQETKLQAIADAIRAKDGTTAPIPANSFAERILAIPSGGLPDDVYTITLTANPPEGGTVSGGGYASAGMTCNANAAPAEGYVFSGWEESGETVHNEAVYSFPVSADRSLTASFSTFQYISGRDWWPAYSPVPLKSVAYGNGKFVAVGNGILSSEDGITWEESTTTISSGLNDVVFGDGKFVAVGENAVFASTDGANWGKISSPSGEWYSVTYGNGKYVMVSAYGGSQAAYSSNCSSWSFSELPFSSNWKTIAYGKEKFVTLALRTSASAYSTDGTNWTGSGLPYGADWGHVTYGNGKFIAVSSDGKAAYSTDGITWASLTLPTYTDWMSVTYGDGKYVALANMRGIAYSADGLNWLNSEITVGRGFWNDLVFGNGKFVAVARTNGDGAIAYSYTGNEAPE